MNLMLHAFLLLYIAQTIFFIVSCGHCILEHGPFKPKGLHAACHDGS